MINLGKFRTSLIITLLCCNTIYVKGQSADLDLRNLQQLANSHDVRTSEWGPFSKKYAGISHVSSFTEGLRFDFSVMPGYYRSKVVIPNVLFESSYFPWFVSDDLNTITYRYELEWKDKVFVDVTYRIVGKDAVHFEVKGVNQTDLPQNLMFNLMANLNYHDHDPKVTLKKGTEVIWKNAVDYASISLQYNKHFENLVHMGYKRGELRSADYVDASALADGFGVDAHNVVKYKLEAIPRKGKLGILYQLKSPKSLSLKLTGLVNKTVALKPSNELMIHYVDFDGANSNLALENLSKGDLAINGLFIVPEKSNLPEVIKENGKGKPAVEVHKSAKFLTIKYPEIEQYYGIKWDNDHAKIRYFLNDELDIFLKEKVHKHVDSVFVGNNKGHFTNVFFNPVSINKHSSNAVSGWIVTGTKQEVEQKLQSDRLSNNQFTKDQRKVNDITTGILPEGKDYTFSVEKLQATLLSNVSFPLYTDRSYIRHYSPGKNWNSLYTWDGGFIALGLNELNKNLAFDCINAYTTGPDHQSAFMHHGSPVPVHIYAFLDLYNKTQSKELLSYGYPRIKKMYEFLAGKLGSSNTRQKSGMIKTWDYFYNSGGWDDYPAQVAVHQKKLTSTVAPVINTTHCIRVAKILKMFATQLNLTADLRGYDDDIEVFSEALQQHSWNDKSNYFSYVVHDEQGNAVGKFLGESGEELNKGLDGAYPLMAGICTDQQKKVLVEKIFSKDHMWTPVGMSVVDQSASYYKRDGYWNGAVWMPHQWFVWKTMLDLGEIDLANRIAMKALEVYNTEVQESYFTYEHFFAESGRGAGWHQFSGLSSPIINWFASYFKIGTVSTGFETLIKDQKFDEQYKGYVASLSFDKSTKANARNMMVCLNPAFDYTVMFNGVKLKSKELHKGLLQITLPLSNADGQLTITRK